VYNSQTNTVKESIHNKFDDKEPDNQMSELVDVWQIKTDEPKDVAPIDDQCANSDTAIQFGITF